VFSWFKKKTLPDQPLLVDIHSHLLPGLDDGVKDFDEAEQIIRYFSSLGFKKLITTPHVMSDAYPNTTSAILKKCEELNDFLSGKNIPVEIRAAAEYYLDERLMEMVTSNEPLLTLEKNYVLFETNFLSEPFYLKEFIFNATTKGYKLILAHPERYLYLQQNFEKAQDLLDRGILFQVNISSLTGYYSRQVQQMAFALIDRGWVHWLGSDCHHLQHARLVEEACAMRYFRKALTLPLLNNTLK
jgi:tyrosine-protein phosphatase YwqE